MIPDVDTSIRDGNLSMCAGDFLEIYSDSSMSFCVPLVLFFFFFLCCKCLVEFVEIVKI